MITKSIGIVGGGTGGLVSALILKSYFPFVTIDLIKSDKIGIIGVGEGSTEHWARFMKQCKIDLAELVRETDATFKYGINFANWNGDGRSYIQSVNGEMNISAAAGIKFVYANLVSKNADPLFLTRPYVVKSQLIEKNYNINQFHFNTFKLNSYLQKKCLEAGINIIEAEIKDVLLDESGYIKELKTTDDRIFNYDLYVDSTGFSRFIIQKTMGIKWKSYQKYLPMNSAIAFPTERLEEIPAWTLSRAMSSGWLWRIPTQERFGNGYVFNDNFLDFDQAQKEVEELYGHEVQIAKKIKFEAGCMEKSWHKNCVAIGLSSSFIEPLEASSIGTSIQQAFILGETLPSYIRNNNFAERTFNAHCDAILENILDFVALHYRGQRDDSPFWKSIKDIPMTPGLEEKLEIYKHKFPTDYDFDNRRVLFQAANWIIVMHGLHLLDPSIAAAELKKLPEMLQKNIDMHMPDFFHDGEVKFITHREAINNLKSS